MYGRGGAFSYGLGEEVPGRQPLGHEVRECTPGHLQRALIVGTQRGERADDG